MSNHNPFDNSDTCDVYPKPYPINTRVRQSCVNTDSLHKVVNMIKDVYKQLADPNFGSTLIAYTEDQTVQEILQYLVNAVENGGGGDSYDDTELRSLISEKLDSSEFSTFTGELELLLESVVTEDDPIYQSIVNKVDQVAGKQLSTEDFTSVLKDKLTGLEGTHWRGTFVSLIALQAGVTDPAAGDYADVDTVGDDVVRYIWDATDDIWVAQSGEVAPITASQVKLLYESNPDTNEFTDADENKLDGIEAGATANSTDAHLLNRVNHTGTQAISTVAGLQGALDGKVNTAPGMGLSSNDYTAVEKSKLGDVQLWATASTQDAAQTALGMSVSGKAVATGTPAQGRTALGLGTAAMRADDYFATADQVGDIASALDAINGEVI